MRRLIFAVVLAVGVLTWASPHMAAAKGDTGMVIGGGDLAPFYYAVHLRQCPGEVAGSPP